jgi:hypothetical protein
MRHAGSIRGGSIRDQPGRLYSSWPVVHINTAYALTIKLELDSAAAHYDEVSGPDSRARADSPFVRHAMDRGRGELFAAAVHG